MNESTLSPVRFKGRTVYVGTFEIDAHGIKHELQMVVSAKGRSVRLYLDGREMK
jgi:hypothetical protein